ncbi:hypothetical protein H0H92_012363 [Tricholoma furcatifolium]|nr:hypothetical protein H0H92_012363 [Tricholoma furcatifolium]
MSDPHSIVEPCPPAIPSPPAVDPNAPASSLAMVSIVPGAPVDSEASAPTMAVVETSVVIEPRAPDLSASDIAPAVDITTAMLTGHETDTNPDVGRLNPRRHQWPSACLRTSATKGFKIYVQVPPNCREYEDYPEPTPNISRTDSPISPANATGGFTSIRIPPA